MMLVLDAHLSALFENHAILCVLDDIHMTKRLFSDVLSEYYHINLYGNVHKIYCLMFKDICVFIVLSQ